MDFAPHSEAVKWRRTVARIEQHAKDAEELPLFCSVSVRDVRLLLEILRRVDGRLSLSRHYVTRLEKDFGEVYGDMDSWREALIRLNASTRPWVCLGCTAKNGDARKERTDGTTEVGT